MKKQPLSPDQLRDAYFSFFEAREHAVVPSSNLVPENDPTTLFTGSGMQPMVPYLLGEKHPKGVRIVDSQKCFRSQDIEEVGDNRHTTFFEMLGNWSLGDYFKKEQLEWIFTFLVDEVGLDPDKLFVTVFSGDDALSIPRDDEAIAQWQELFAQKKISAELVTDAEENGLQGGRIFTYPASKNWWSRAGVPENMPIGEPGGPDSEIFFDFGEEHQLHQNSEFRNQPCHVNCDCGRFLEIGNNVFMTYQKTESGYELLAKKNIDFGGGFERILAAVTNDPDVFKTGAFLPIISHLEQAFSVTYGDDPQPLRVIADHVKAAIMLAADGVVPANKAQGYFLRRLIRRAVRYGQRLGASGPFLAGLVPVVAKIYEHGYPDVGQKVQEIQELLLQEEEKFSTSLDKGLKEFDKRITKKLTAVKAFQLYETYGFPLELSIEEAEKNDIPVENAIHELFAEHKASHASQSRTASAGTFKGGLADQSQATIQYHTATHLLHAALRKVLGTHVEQKGSNITGKRLRFDFSHPQALTDQEKEAVLHLVQSWIEAELPVSVNVMDKQSALDSGAIAFFVEKYPDEVTVYTIGHNPEGSQGDLDNGWVSKELCGGPHVENTREIGDLVIKKEQATSAGVRRIYMELVE